MTTTHSTRPTSLAEWDARFTELVAPYFADSDKQAENFRPLPTDLFVTPYAKCGTTWLQQIVHGLRTRGDMDFDDISRVVPWIGVSAAFGLDINAPQRGAFRALKSHESSHNIPKGGRYLLSLRDPKDALVSSFRFGEGWSFAFGSVSIADYARESFLKNRAEGSYWHHLLSWWEQKDNPNVLLLCYEEMKKDLPGTVQRIADFVGIELDEELREIVLRQSSLDFMLQHKDKFDDYLMPTLFPRAGALPPGGDSAKVRKGEVGQHHYELPADISAELDTIWQEEIESKLGFASYKELCAAL